MDTVRSQEWRYREEDIGLASIIAERLDIHQILARLMVSRSILDPQEAYDILHPSLRNLHDPFQFSHMERSVKRIERAIEKGIKKVVFDRNGFLYHGRVKAVSDGAREAGLDF